MIPLRGVFRVQVRYWARHRVQVLLCLAGIALGVGVFSAIQLANQGALRAFAQGVEAFSGRATHRVYAPGGGGVPESLYLRLAGNGGVEAATPLLRSRLLIQGEEPLTLTVLGVDPLADPRFLEYALPPSSYGASEEEAASLLRQLLAEPGAVLVPRSLWNRLGLRAGAELQGVTVAGPRRFRAIGFFRPPPAWASSFSRTLLTDLATHQEQFGKLGVVDSIQLMVRPGMEKALSALLPPGVVIEPAGGRVRRVEEISRAFRLNLEVLGLFAMLVAMFLIFNAAAFSVIQREKTIAMVRCIGAPARSVFAAILLESVILGLLGSLGGLVLGRWLGGLMLRNTGATLFEVVLGIEALPASVEVGPGIGWAAMGLGVGVSVAGSLLPAWQAARTSPLAGMRGARSSPAGGISILRWMAVGALSMLLALLALALPGKSLWAGLAGATALVLGGGALCPPAIMAVGRSAGPLLGGMFGAPGRMAASNLGRLPSRAGIAAASLMVALSLALSIGITVKSFKRTFEIWLDQAVTADVYIEPYPLEGEASLPPGFLRPLAGLPFVRESALLYSTKVVLGPREVRVLGIDLPAVSRTTRFPTRDATQEEVFARVAAGEILISEPLASPLSLARGDALDLPVPGGTRRFRIGAVVQNYTNPQGIVYMEKKHFTRLFGSGPPHYAAVWLKPGFELEEALRTLESLPGAGNVRLVPNGNLRASALEVFDRSFVITDLMGGLVAFVAFISVISALMALLEERTRLMGIVRAIGMTRRGLGLSMILEAVLLAGGAAVAGWGTGLMVSAVLVFVVNPRAFGWSLQFLPGEGSYGGLLALAVAAALLGSVYPIYRAARLSVGATLRDE